MGSVACGNCRTPLTEDPSARAEARRPCHNCGSTRRHFSTVISESVSGHASVSTRFILKANTNNPLDAIDRLPPAAKRLVGLSLITALWSLVQSSGKRLQKPPGSTLLCIVDFLYSPATVERIFKQLVADWRDEYFAAVRAKRGWKACWINICYGWCFLKAMGLSKAFSLLSRVIRRS